MRWLLLAMWMAGSAWAAEADRWWPIQKMPQRVARVTTDGSAAQQFLAQSIAGVAAKAVNERRGEELVWVEAGGDLAEWFVRWQKKHAEVTVSKSETAWDLAERLAESGVIKGCILYRADASKGGLNEHRAGMDLSVNVATSLAGILGGVIVEEKLEEEAKRRRLKLLIDARGKTQAWCFETYKDQFARGMLCAQDPKKPHTRDLAIAQRAFTIYGDEPALAKAMEWMEPLSPVLGWNGGDEYETALLSTRFGHIQTATDWCMNLPVLMAGSETNQPSKAKGFAPSSIDWKEQRSGVTFIDTDGDNVQWLQGNFFHHPSYWGNSARGKIPFGWSACLAQLAELCPAALEFAAESQTPNDSVIEWGAGYYYPDRFGESRANRWELLAAQSRRTWSAMRKTGAQIIGFNMAKFDSPDALKAYQTIAGETDGLLGILVFQYSPYEAGAGKTFWVKDKNGVEIPAVSARYSIWENSNQRPRSGTPAKVAREIRQDLENNPKEFQWCIAHVWSYFKNAPGSDENAENLPQNRGETESAKRGYDPVLWCAERLPQTARVVAPEEMLWRIRMAHNPRETRVVLEKQK